MSIRTALIVVLALMFGGSAAVAVNMVRSAPNEMKAETVSILVAALDIPRYTTVTANMLKPRDYPKDFVPNGAVVRVEDVLDRVTDTQLLKDEPILEAKLSGKGAGRGLAAVIPMGMRAVTVRTPNVACGVGGFALPGNKVDLLLTVNGLNDSTGGGSTTTLLQNVEILAVDQRLDAPTSNMMDLKELRSVTLLVTPDQAAKVDLGQNMGTLHLSLRNPQDKEPGGAGVATLSDLRIFQGRPWDERLKSVLDMASKMMAARKPEKEKTETPAVAKEPPPAVPPKIRTLRGTVQGEVAFQ